MAIDLKPKYVVLVKTILNKYIPQAEVWVFGSRTTTQHHPYSDLDLLIRGSNPIPLSTLGLLMEEFADSDLPYKVDLVDWHRISQEFKDSIAEQLEPL